MLHIAQPGTSFAEYSNGSPMHILYFPVRVWADFNEEHSDSGSTTPILRPVHSENDPQLRALFKTIELEATTPHPIGELYFEGLSLSLMALLFERYSTKNELAAPSGRSGMSPKQMKRVHEFIHSNLDQPIYLAQLAAETGFSPIHFAALFRRTTGMRPHEYLTHLV